MDLSEKQVEYINNANCRWNFKDGATRSGKTHLDYHLVPRRIRERKGLSGLNVILGTTKSTIQRNIIVPMQDMYGISSISSIKQDNTATIFGETVYCLGANKSNSVDVIRGSSFKYIYGDEITTWHEETFEMIKSRLDKTYSLFEGTCNPKEPSHWLYKFMNETTVDIYRQNYTIFDNPFLPIDVLRDIINSHTGVFKQRYIYGLWCVAEGIIFRNFADHTDEYLFEHTNEEYNKFVMGVDFGGTGSKTTMTLTGYRKGYKYIDALESSGLPINQTIDAADIGQTFVEFCSRINNKYGLLGKGQKIYVFADNASPTMINTLRTYAKNNSLFNVMISGCKKTELVDRPRFIDLMLTTHKLRIEKNNTEIINALSKLRWGKDSSIPEDLNIENINDWYDAFCYSFTTYQPYIEQERM